MENGKKEGLTGPEEKKMLICAFRPANEEGGKENTLWPGSGGRREDRPSPFGREGGKRELPLRGILGGGERKRKVAA